jgi:hypothetical protein
MPSAIRFRNRSARIRSQDAAAGTGDPPASWAVLIDLDADGAFGNTAAETVTSDVLRHPGIRTYRGVNTQEPLFPARAGTASWDLLNNAGTYDEGSDLTRNKRVRVRSAFQGVTRDWWTGRISSLRIDPNPERRRVDLAALDGLSQLLGTGHSTQLYSSITINTAIGHLLDAAGWPSTERSIDASTRTLTHWWLDPDEDALSALLRLVRTDGPQARLYVNGSGTIVFKAHGARTSDSRSTNSQATFTGSTTEPVASRITHYRDGRRNIVNRVALEQRTRTGASAVSRGTATSNGGTETVSITTPTGSAGDMLIYAVAGWRTDAGVALQEPGDVTLIGTANFTASYTPDQEHEFRVYSRVHRGTNEPASRTWGSPGFSAVFVAGCMVYSNVRAVEAVTSTSDSTDDTSSVSADVTSAGGGRVLMSLFGGTANSVSATTHSPPTDMTEQVDVNAGSGTNVWVAMYDELDVSPGAQGAKTSAASQAVAEGAISLILAPEAEAVVWSAGGDIVLGNDETQTFIAAAVDPFNNAQTPTSGIDYTVSAGSIAGGPTLDRTSGQRVEIRITAGASGVTIRGPTDQTDRGLQLRATPQPVVASNEVLAEDSGSQSTYSTRGLPGSYRIWHDISIAAMQTLAADILQEYKDPKRETTLLVHGARAAATLNAVLAREINDRITITITAGNIAFDGYVEGIAGLIADIGHLDVELSVREV